MDKLFLEERYDFGEVFIDDKSATGGNGANNLSSMDALRRTSLYMDDLIVFFALESLGTLAIVGNCCLVVVLMRNRYLQRASFVLMLSLALADILHGIVTTTFFYPPIVLRRLVVPPIGVRIFNIIDWTAWSITLTHMSAICLDRLLAITLYGQYSQLITVRRAKLFTVTCWIAFSALNIIYILAHFCCLISPLAQSQFYTFGYGEFESKSDRLQSPLRGANLFKLTYTPLELCTLAVLTISNPITFIQLYRRHKRKMALKIRHSASASKCAGSGGGSEAMIRRASTMLLEMSMRMGSKHVSTEMHEGATRRANRQQQRILFQISVVAIIFYLYMFAYYLLYHVFNVSNKWLVLFNSFFYSTTHMINPMIYFSLNKDMRAQLIRAIADCLNWACCVDDVAGLSRQGGMHSSVYGRGGGSKRTTQPGGESSSGGSVLLHKSSYGGGCMTEANSSVQTDNNVKAGWMLRSSSSSSRPHNRVSAMSIASSPSSLMASLKAPAAPAATVRGDAIADGTQMPKSTTPQGKKMTMIAIKQSQSLRQMPNERAASMKAYRPPPPSSSAAALLAKRSVGTTPLSPTFASGTGTIRSAPVMMVPNERSAMLLSCCASARPSPSASFSAVNAAAAARQHSPWWWHAPDDVRLHDANNNDGRGPPPPPPPPPPSENGGPALARLARTLLADAVGTVAAAVGAVGGHGEGDVEGRQPVAVPFASATAHNHSYGTMTMLRTCPRSDYALPAAATGSSVSETNRRRSGTASSPDSYATRPAAHGGGGSSPGAGSLLMRESLPASPQDGSVLFRELSGSVRTDDDQPMGELLELQLVDSWDAEEQEEDQQRRWRLCTGTASAAYVGTPLPRHKDTLERLVTAPNGHDSDNCDNQRRLGMFLAARLANELPRSERAAARATRQRNSLLDSLISALIQCEDEDGVAVVVGDEDGGEQCPDELQLNNNNNNNNISRQLGRGKELTAPMLCRKKSRSMDLLKQYQQHEQQQPRQHGQAVQQPGTATRRQQKQQQPNGRLPNKSSESDSHGTGIQPMSSDSLSSPMSISGGGSDWRRRTRRRSCDARKGYVPLRESECDDQESGGDEHNEDDEEDVIFL